MRIPQVFAILSWITVGGFVAGVAASILRSWSWAAAVAGWSAVVGASVFVFLCSFLVLLRLKPDVGVRLVMFFVDTARLDPNDKARVIAESVSETINCGAWACIAGLLCSLVWALARWRLAAMSG